MDWVISAAKVIGAFLVFLGLVGLAAWSPLLLILLFGAGCMLAVTASLVGERRSRRRKG